MKTVLISVLAFSLSFLFSCTKSSDKATEVKLARYKQIEKIEKQLASIKNLVKLTKKSGLSSLLKNHYRKQLAKEFKSAQVAFEESSSELSKIRSYLSESNNLYDNSENVFSDSIQLGFALETQTATSSFLNQLKNKTININGRILNVKYAKKANKVKLRIGFADSLLKTDKLVMTYIDVETKSLKNIDELRRYHDVSLKLKVKKTYKSESNNFTIITINGSLKKVTIKGWLGLASWANDRSLLPRPKAKANDTKKSKGKIKKRSSKSKAKKKSKKSSSKETKPKTTTKPKTNYQDDWNDDDDFGD